MSAYEYDRQGMLHFKPIRPTAFGKDRSTYQKNSPYKTSQCKRLLDTTETEFKLRLTIFARHK